MEYIQQKDQIPCDACVTLGQYNDQFHLGACNILTHIKLEVERTLVQIRKAFNTAYSLEFDEYYVIAVIVMDMKVTVISYVFDEGIPLMLISSVIKM